ncbi:MAG: hypothetical protein KIT32_12265 [Rhodocyclaceae bacterium]|nr:hypothetical protein [Rhodocyclaceae bacterium]
MTLAVAIVLGAIWRRWWGDERPPWAFPGYRGVQFAAGVVCLYALHPTWLGLGMAIAAVVIATLPIKFFRPIWWAWDRVPVPNLGRWFYQPTNYAEATQGALIFGLACLP